MPIYLLSEEHPELFPPPDRADKSGVLAVGGDLSPERLLAAYSRGIFPWFSEGDPILWHSPDPRFVLEPDKLHVGRSLRKTLARGEYEVRYDTAFARVITECGRVTRPGQNGTWITDEMLEAYVALHERGYAHSVEAWAGGELKGGLYGVSLGAAFFGESMFALAPDASKVAFVTAVERFKAWGFQFVDCQVETEHLSRFGAESWPRKRFLTALREALRQPTRQGKWTQPASE
ncbi:leucyl/phenylalanyl-tRNA--protein transferase [Myxococcus fulvus]|uniref:Leucyl/phenylalanyl-tRNA--protein transferase n=1 Tax=Myxococcus fulvus TaxID=33 RepID=A0A511SVH0_MYXFU|nr:leucyl/phenylalanyl-tRNA--protein transferase [Myxococcus fulvus]GEN05168.1 leucyl/phenylalanyl-tRNA--protein transferase [Myxococcus fulvus]SET16138.1 leucyl/phenylalanyl-tRNA--protein transferase [Myxococcus fulvus]